MKRQEEYISFRGNELGSIHFTPGHFSKDFYTKMESALFAELDTFKKHEEVSSMLLRAIQDSEEGLFLLPTVVNFLAHVRKVLPTYHLASFEFWLNQNAGISEEEKMRVRGKIVGKWIPRSEYQNFFPLQKEVYFPGSHYSYAHISPDLDTTVASFSCFLAAFGAKVGEGRHLWVLPGGPPKEMIEIDFLFRKAFGEEVFHVISLPSTKFTISALDLVSQKNIVRTDASTLTYNIDPERGKKAVILVDERGCYLGDWRAGDVDPVRSVIERFRAFLSEYQNQFVVGVTTLFSMNSLDEKDWVQFLHHKLLSKFSDGMYIRALNEKQRTALDSFIKEVLLISSGMNATIGEFFESAERFGFSGLQEELKKGGLFDKQGKLIEDRTQIFKKLENIFLLEKEAFDRFFSYMDSLEAAMDVKKKVLKREPSYLSHLAEYDEIAQAIKNYGHLTVNYQEDGNQYPLGVIYAEDIKRKVIATTSWNDFSNPGETDLKEGVEVISFIDHHKSNVVTSRPSLGIVRADAQSTNSIIARINFEINDRYSTGGMSLETIEHEIKKIAKEAPSPKQLRLLQRLLQKKNTALTRGENYISPERESLEYLQYIFAILDDTDLLTKVTDYDVDGMASLLNRLKTIMLGKEVEVVDFDDLSRSDPTFPQKAAKKLMQTPDLYSLYGVIYKRKEEVIDRIIRETGEGKEAHFFQDTKVLGSGGYVSIGQFKHFAKNEPVLKENRANIRRVWVNRCEKSYEEKPEILLHIMMLSTVASAEELFSDKPKKPDYLDELWFWIPNEKRAAHALQNFLEGLAKSPRAEGQELVAQFCGKSDVYEEIFAEAFQHKKMQFIYTKTESTMAVLKVQPGSIKSRKTDVAVYL